MRTPAKSIAQNIPFLLNIIVRSFLERSLSDLNFEICLPMFVDVSAKERSRKERTIIFNKNGIFCAIDFAGVRIEVRERRGL
jgi:hypothetical protein